MNPLNLKRVSFTILFKNKSYLDLVEKLKWVNGSKAAHRHLQVLENLRKLHLLWCHGILGVAYLIAQFGHDFHDNFIVRFKRASLFFY